MADIAEACKLFTRVEATMTPKTCRKISLPWCSERSSYIRIFESELASRIHETRRNLKDKPCKTSGNHQEHLPQA